MSTPTGRRKAAAIGLATMTAALGSHLARADLLGAQSLHVEALETEYQQNPIGIDARAPRLSWRIHAVRRGTMQSAYELRVATDSASLQRSSLWTSGRVTSAASTFRPYGGPALRSGARYYWQVRFGRRRTGVPMERAGVLGDGPPRPRRLGGALDHGGPERRHDAVEPEPDAAARVHARAGHRSARLYVTSLGLNAVELNGQTVGDRLLRRGGRATASGCSTTPTMSLRSSARA